MKKKMSLKFRSGKSARLAVGKDGMATLDWRVLSAAAVALIAIAAAALNAGLADRISSTFSRIVADAVDAVGNDNADSKLNYTQGCKTPCASKSLP